MADEARRQARRPIASSRPESTAGRCMAFRFRSRIFRRGRHGDDSGLARQGRSRAERRCAGDLAPAACRRGYRRQDQPARVRVRHDQRGLGVRARPPSTRPDRDRQAARAAARRPASSQGWPSPAWARTRAARSGFLPRHAAWSALSRLRRSLGARCRAAVADARPCGPAHRDGDRRVAPAPRPARSRAGQTAVADAGSRRCGWRVPRRYFCDLLDDDVRRTFEASVDALRKHGATVVDVDIPHAGLIAPIYLHIVLADAAAYHADALDAMPERYTPNVRLRLEMGRYVTAEDYVRALDGRRTLHARSGRGAVGPSRPPVADPAHRRADTGGKLRAGRGNARAGAQRDASADAVLQPHRASGHHPSVRSVGDRSAVRPATGRRDGSDRQPSSYRPRRRTGAHVTRQVLVKSSSQSTSRPIVQSSNVHPIGCPGIGLGGT